MQDLLKFLVLLPVRLYQKLLSPLLPPSCRFHPTCSRYMVEAVEEWGILRGIWLGLKRLASCHPWSPGGHDPIPKKRVNG